MFCKADFLVQACASFIGSYVLVKQEQAGFVNCMSN